MKILNLASIWYHGACLELFRPFLLKTKQTEFPSWVSSDQPTHAIFAASLKQLERLILEHMSRDESVMYQPFWHIAMMYVANAALSDAVDPDHFSYFHICIRAYQRLYPVWHFVETTVQGLLGMAVKKGLITKADAQIYAGGLKHDDRHRIIEKRGDHGYVVDLELAFTDSSAARVDKLVNQFEQIVVSAETTESGP